jgi:hypothetical protein
MPRKSVQAPATFSSPTDHKIVKLTVISFALSSVLFIAGIFKINSVTRTMPFSQSRDYVVFEKTTRLGEACSPNKMCSESLKVYRSGKVIGLGSNMFVNVLNPRQMDSLISTIDRTGILNKDCQENPDKANQDTYTIKLGVQIKRASSDMCKAELDQIESQIFQ